MAKKKITRAYTSRKPKAEDMLKARISELEAALARISKPPANIENPMRVDTWAARIDIKTFDVFVFEKQARWDEIRDFQTDLSEKSELFAETKEKLFANIAAFLEKRIERTMTVQSLLKNGKPIPLVAHRERNKDGELLIV